MLDKSKIYCNYKPLDDENEDLLGYVSFLDYIFDHTKFLLNNDEPHTIGITAEWGDGKTSFINFLKKRIKNNFQKIKLQSLTFNFKPIGKFFWDKLVLLVLSVFLLILLLCTFNINFVIIVYFWLLLTFTFCTKLNFKNIKNALKNIFLKRDYIIIDFNPWFCKNEKQVIEEFFKILSENIEISNKNDFNKYAKLILKQYKIDIDIILESPSLKGTYDKISNSLKQSNKKIVIFIDDTDRMCGEEILNLLKLIKKVADFPNTLYILTYNKQYITSELSKILNYNSEKYLEKIIEDEYRLPNIRVSRLKDIFINKIDEIIGNNADNYDKEDIQIIFDDSISEYVTNLRKLYKLINSFCFYYNIYKILNIKINISDLIILTTLKLFNLNLFDRIWNEKLNIYSKEYIFNNEERKKNEETYIVGKIKYDELPETDKYLLEKLFKSEKDKYDIKRLRDEEHFDIYFQYDFPKNDIEIIKTWIESYPQNRNNLPKYDFSINLLSDLGDFMYSNFYYEKRNLNFIFALLTLMINDDNIASKLYYNNDTNSRFYLGENDKYINNFNEEKIAEFIDNNKEKCNINLLEWLTFDFFYYDGTSSFTPKKKLSNNINIIKKSVVSCLREKLERCDLSEIKSLRIFNRFRLTYKFDEVIKKKLLDLLKADDKHIIKTICQFRNEGYSSNVGKFYGLSIVDIIKFFGIDEQFKKRLSEIQNNNNVMKNNDYIAYYSDACFNSEERKMHIVDAILYILENRKSFSA